MSHPVSVPHFPLPHDPLALPFIYQTPPTTLFFSSLPQLKQIFHLAISGHPVNLLTMHAIFPLPFLLSSSP